MARRQGFTMLIYPEDKEFIRKSTLRYQDIETGGDLFGLWRNESEVVVQLVTGPGERCRRTQTAFFQDKTYLSEVGGYLTTAKGLCNMGEWHSHHRLNLPEPSGGDRATVWRNMSGLGLKRFLLIIATIIPTGQVDINGFMFTPPTNGSSYGGMDRVHTRVLTGPNPFRHHPEVLARLHEGAETSATTPSQYGPTSVAPSQDVPGAYDETPNTGHGRSSKKLFRGKKSKKVKINKQDKQDKENKKFIQPTEKSKKKFSRFRRNKGEPSYNELVPDGGTSGYFSQSNFPSDSMSANQPLHSPAYYSNGQRPATQVTHQMTSNV